MDEHLSTTTLCDTSSDEYSSDNSDSDVLDRSDTESQRSKSSRTLRLNTDDCDTDDNKNRNILIKLFNRENTGVLSSNISSKMNQKAFRKVPNRLKFCLKDIVPVCFLDGHVFMGLTACGQFLLSYDIYYDEAALSNECNFRYKYSLYFWIYRPYQPLGQYFKVCLFDDHGVGNFKIVTMIQWMNRKRILIVHGAADDDNEDSFITVVRVPKLGCLDCKELRNFNGFGDRYCNALCIQCNLTIHIKYSTTESDPVFLPKMNLCPDRLVFIANGFIHMVHIELEMKRLQQAQQQQQQHHQQQQQFSINMIYNQNQLKKSNNQAIDTLSNNVQKNEKTVMDSGPDDCGIQRLTHIVNSSETICDNMNYKNSIVDRIIADFSEFESDESQSQGNHHYYHPHHPHYYAFHNFHNHSQQQQDLSIADKTCRLTNVQNKNSSESLINSTGPSSSSIRKSSENTDSQSKLNMLSKHQQTGTRRSPRIVTKSYKNNSNNVELQTGAAADKASAYEFSEENEKCEKIGTFRKRRLADKKYEFSEDNSENIIPFTTARLSITKSRPTRLHRSLGPTLHHSPYPSGPMYMASASLSPSYETTNHLHRASPSQGFRSPCGSPVGSSRYLRSPTNRTNQSFHQKSPSATLSPSTQQVQTKSVNTLSPRQISSTRRAYFELGNVSPTHFLLSPRRDEPTLSALSNSIKANDCNSAPLTNGFEKPACTKKFKRLFVEEDDAASVITSGEDDCISPGYHTSLPVEVHGSCYSDMQMISESSYQKLQCPAVAITQHSFDLETFTYHVIDHLCKTNDKVYDVFYDWACETINVCPNSFSILCILMAHFTARDLLPNNTKKCVNCARNLDCVFHRKQFECRVLFEWNMESGEWIVLDYGKLIEIPSPRGKAEFALIKVAKKIANEMQAMLKAAYRYEHNLRVIHAHNIKSKNHLIDMHNLIELHRKRPKLGSYAGMP